MYEEADKVLKNLEVEVATKYVYLWILKECQHRNENPIDINIKELSETLGVSCARIYRARGQLVKSGAIIHTKKFCPLSGKRVSDLYKVR